MGEDIFEESERLRENLWIPNVKEVRTTSSTGGQKGVKLARFDLIPTGPLHELAEHFGVGAMKYDSHQWRQGYEWSKSYSALVRHLNEFWAGKDYDVCSNDPEGCSHVDSKGEPFKAAREDACYNHTGSHHMVAVMWHAAVLLEFKDTHSDHDDRYIPHSLEREIDEAGWNFNKVNIIDVRDDGIYVEDVLACTCITSESLKDHSPEQLTEHLRLYHQVQL